MSGHDPINSWIMHLYEYIICFQRCFQRKLSQDWYYSSKVNEDFFFLTWEAWMVFPKGCLTVQGHLWGIHPGLLARAPQTPADVTVPSHSRLLSWGMFRRLTPGQPLLPSQESSPSRNCFLTQALLPKEPGAELRRQIQSLESRPLMSSRGYTS